MKKLVIGVAVLGFIALLPKSEARLSGTLELPHLNVISGEKPEEKSEIGVASWYGEDFQGNETANGEIYDLNGLTAAHPTLPFGTTVRVTNLQNNKNILLRINDRGPYVGKRVIDVSLAAAKRLGFVFVGITRVRIDVVSYPKSFVPPSKATTNP